jgi:mono/diheme cytochrome c family protein
VKPLFALIALALVAFGTAACGSAGIAVSEDDPTYDGAVIFSERCGGCHTLAAAGTQGSGNRSLRQQGPNLDQRVETYEDALFAIRNGGFSGAIMPQNIVVGDDAEAVARFLDEYSGSDINTAPRPSPEEDQSLQQQEDSKPDQGTSAGFDSEG